MIDHVLATSALTEARRHLDDYRRTRRSDEATLALAAAIRAGSLGAAQDVVDLLAQAHRIGAFEAATEHLETLDLQDDLERLLEALDADDPDPRWRERATALLRARFDAALALEALLEAGPTGRPSADQLARLAAIGQRLQTVDTFLAEHADAFADLATTVASWLEGVDPLGTDPRFGALRMIVSSTRERFAETLKRIDAARSRRFALAPELSAPTWSELLAPDHASIPRPRVAADALVRLASEDDDLPALRELERVERVRASALPTGVELGVIRGASWQVLAWTAGLKRGRLLDPTAPTAELVRRVIEPSDGLLRLELARHFRPVVLELETATNRIALRLDEELVSGSTPVFDQHQRFVRHARALDNRVLALGELHRQSFAVRGLRATLAHAAFVALGRTLSPEQRHASTDLPLPPPDSRATPRAGRVGVVNSLATWNTHGGAVAVTSVAGFGGFTEREPFLELMAHETVVAETLRAAGELGWAAGRRARGQAVKDVPPPPAPQLDVRLVELGLTTTGKSAALAAALAAYSREIERPVPDNLFVTGVLDAAGNVGQVEPATVAEKLAFVAREHPRARVLLPRANESDVPPDHHRLNLVFVATFSEAADETFGAAHRTSLTTGGSVALLDEAAKLERQYRRTEALELADRFLAADAGTHGERLRAHVISAMCHTHLGRPDDAEPHETAARALLDQLERDDLLEFQDAVFFSLTQADRLADLFRYREAIEVLERARERWAKGSPVLRAKLDGFMGLVRTYEHRGEDAEVALRRAISHGDRLDVPRFFCWLSLALAEQGRHAEAVAAANAGLDHADQVRGPSHQANLAYLHRARARAELRRGDPRAALDAARAGIAVVESGAPFLSPYPLSSLRHLRGKALVELGQVDEGVKALASVRELLNAGDRTPFSDLAFGVALIEHARVLAQARPKDAETLRALDEARLLISSFAPAADRYSAELLSEEADAFGLTRVTNDLPY